MSPPFYFGRDRSENEQDPDTELSPAKRAYTEKWLDEVAAETDVGELVSNGSGDSREPSTDRDSMSITESVDTIDRNPTTAKRPKRRRSPSPHTPSHVRRSSQFIGIPSAEDLEEMARRPAKLSPMSKVDLLNSNDDDQLDQQRQDILQDYVRHLVRSAMRNNQQPDVVVDKEVKRLHPSYRLDSIQVLQLMLRDMIEGMSDDDRAIVEDVMHRRGSCQISECPRCQRGSRKRGRTA